MRTNICAGLIILVLSLLFLVSFAGCVGNNANDISTSITPSATITPTSDSVETISLDNKDIDQIGDLDKLDQVISINEVILSEYYYELYRSSVEYHGLPEALNDKFNYKIRYKSDDCEVIGYISAPADYLEKNYPLLIYNRGGHGNLGEVTPAEVSLYAHMGFITLATQYRGNDGGTGKDEFGDADVQDVISLIDIAEQLPFGNGKLYMFGASRGGIETYCALKEEYLAKNDRISAAIVAFGVSDLEKLYQFRDQFMKNILIKYVGGTPEQVPEEYAKRSAVCWPELINTPLLILHGKTDERVPVEQAETMYDKLKEQNKDVELMLYDGVHDYTPESFSYMFEWLLSY